MSEIQGIMSHNHHRINSNVYNEILAESTRLPLIPSLSLFKLSQVATRVNKLNALLQKM